MAADTGKPVRVLHIVGGLDRGGVETWLVNVLRHIDRKRYSMDFVVHTTKACAYDDEVRALGARIFPCPYTHRPLKYASELRRILEEHGPYDVVHSHVYHYSGWVLQQASASGVPTRIAHSFNSISTAKSDISFLRRGYMRAMNYLIDRYATHKLANSKLSAASLFGEEWPRDPRYRLLYCGIDLAPFEETVNQGDVRRQLGIPPDAFVIGHVGRFVEQKNHTFLIDIAGEVMRRHSDTYLLLVGDGPLRPAIEQKVADLGLRDRVVLTGTRADITRLMLGGMDVFVFPSLWEGLPTVGVLAQAAGLYSVFSDTITDEFDIVPNLAAWLPLSKPPAEWAQTILAARDLADKHSTQDALASVQASPFSIEHSVQELRHVYGGV